MGARCRFLRDRTTAIVPKAFARDQACQLRFIDPRIDEIRKAFKEFCTVGTIGSASAMKWCSIFSFRRVDHELRQSLSRG